jgi:geranylgeranyl diphosphate synthase type I
MYPETALSHLQALERPRAIVEPVLEGFLVARMEEMAAIDRRAAALVGEILRLLAAGGKRIRPAFCYWGYRAGGGTEDATIAKAAAALELFHTFALIHDDLMDESDRRRGVPSVHVRLAEDHPGPADRAERYGRSGAILIGDLAAVLADELLLASEVPADRLLAALRRYDQMRIEVAAGQFLDVAGVARDEPSALRVAALKTGAYTVEGPLHIGAILAGASLEAMAGLSAYARPLGEAFQLRDDVLDHGEGSAPGATAATVDELLDRADAALDGPHLVPEAVAALRSLGGALRL